MSKIFFDISLPIHNKMLVWPGDDPVEITTTATVAKDGVGDSHLSLGSHTGTHIDAPKHFVVGGSGIDSIPIEKLVGECEVVDLTNISHKEIMVSDVSHLEISKGSRILFKTGNYKYLAGSIFPNFYVSLSLEAAKYLVEKGVWLLGIDFLGIEKRKSPGHPVHTALLKAGIVNVEGLDLSEVPAGKYDLICLPLKVKDADGAPARVVLIKKGDPETHSAGSGPERSRTASSG